MDRILLGKNTRAVPGVRNDSGRHRARLAGIVSAALPVFSASIHPRCRHFLGAAAGRRGRAIHRPRQAEGHPRHPQGRTASTGYGCGSSTIRRPRRGTPGRATATWTTRWRWRSGSRPQGCGSCWTSTTATPGPIRGTSSSLRPGRICMEPSLKRPSMTTPETWWRR